MVDKLTTNKDKNKDNINLKTRFEASFILHALGDTIGFNNGKWEFMRGDSSKVYEKVNQFVSYGGINYIPQKDWRISDDTILHIKTAQALLSDYNSINSLGITLRKKYIEAFDEFLSEDLEKRYPGRTTLENLKKMKKLKWNELDYDFYYGGSGASMRSCCIGLAYYGEENRHKLIQVSIESSRITHNSATGYLGGMCSALFTAFAIENIDILDWPFKLIELFENNTIPKIVRELGRDVKEYFTDFRVFFGKWKRYVEEKFNDRVPIIKKSSNNLLWRSSYYHRTFSDTSKDQYFPGSGGDDSVIIAYDCLLDSDFIWEKLVFYAMMHGGDTDTTGCIAACWYGALKGYGDVPIHVLKNLEEFDNIKKLSNDFYNKFK